MNSDSPAISYLRELIAIPSVNPDCDATGTGEKKMAARVAAILSDLGAEVWTEEVLPDRPNVIGKFASNQSSDGKKKPRLLFAPHLDTVGVSGMAIDPFAGDLVEGKIFGRGACDTKGTMAAMLAAFQKIGSGGIADAPVEVSFVGLVGEEFRQPGSKHFAERHRGEFDFAIVGEPTENAAVVRHKACLWATLATEGRSAHGSMPEAGVNAIHRMARLVDALNGSFRDWLARESPSDPLLSPSTLNIGVIRGGAQPNIVAESCELEVDLRVTPGLIARHDVVETLEKFVAAQENGARVVSVVSAPALENDLSHPMICRLEKLGIPLVGASWFCDGSILAAGGIPSVALGPGVIAQAHTADEWIAVEQLETGVITYESLILGNL